MADTVPEGSRLVKMWSVPQRFRVRGQTIWVYDFEFMVALVTDWHESGMSKTEIEDFLLSV